MSVFRQAKRPSVTSPSVARVQRKERKVHSLSTDIKKLLPSTGCALGVERVQRSTRERKRLTRWWFGTTPQKLERTPVHRACVKLWTSKIGTVCPTHQHGGCVQIFFRNESCLLCNVIQMCTHHASQVFMSFELHSLTFPVCVSIVEVLDANGVPCVQDAICFSCHAARAKGSV